MPVAPVSVTATVPVFLLAFRTAILGDLALSAEHQFLECVSLVAVRTHAHFSLITRSLVLSPQACADILFVEEFYHLSLTVSP
jgi:hypothetical protein